MRPSYCMARLQGCHGQWYPALHCHSSGVRWAVVPFSRLPHCWRAVGSGLLQCTAELQGGSGQWYPSAHCYTARGLVRSDILQCTGKLQGGVVDNVILLHRGAVGILQLTATLQGGVVGSVFFGALPN